MTQLSPELQVDDRVVPRFFYGTAWKEQDTAECVFEALRAGFTAIDTANQRKHYFEAGAGEGIQRFLKETDSRREDLFLQTKFTFSDGQDHRKPYDERSPFAKQVADSFASSLQHLNTDYIDSYVLHGPHSHGEDALDDADYETWEAMEAVAKSGRAKFLGVSNISAPRLLELIENSKVKPRFVQNRCFARFGWDKEVRDICGKHGVLYQGFSLLTANQTELSSPTVSALARRYEKSVPQIVFRFCLQLNGDLFNGNDIG